MINNVDIDKRNKLVEENYTLVYDFVNKNKNKYFSIEYEDLVQYCLIGLIKAATNFNDKKGKFSTLAFLCMRNIVNQIVRDQNTFHNKQQATVSLDSCIISPNGDSTLLSDLIADSYDCYEEIYLDDFCYIAYNKLTKREKFVLDTYFRLGCCTNKTIKELQVTRQYVLNIVNKYKKLLKKEIAMVV